MSERIAPDTGRTKHGKEIEFFNHLLIDLKLREMGMAPHDSITMERLNEGSVHISKLSDCREPTRFYR